MAQPSENQTGPNQKAFKFLQWNPGGTVARLTLNRPPQNILSIDMMTEMGNAIDQLHGREEVRLLILDSACPGFFSAGAGTEGYTGSMVFQMMERFPSNLRAHAGSLQTRVSRRERGCLGRRV